MTFINKKITETKTCEKCQVSFEIRNKDLEFYDKMSPVFGGKKYQIPTPKLCPSCRQQRRISFRNERSLYRRKCDLSGVDIVASLSPDKPNKVYSLEVWWGDDWEGLDYGRGFNFSRDFFEQFGKLLMDVPHIASVIINSDNCEYNAYCVDSKDCFMCQRIQGENLYYNYLAIENSLWCIDNYNIVGCEHCYELIDSEKCSNSTFLQNCHDCYNCHFSYDLEGCKDCFACVGLRNKQYCFGGKQYPKQQYLRKIKDFQDLSSQKIKEAKGLLKDQKNNFTHRENTNVNIENCVGNNINNSKDVYRGFELNHINEGSYIMSSSSGENVMDADYNYYGNNNYEMMSCAHGNNSYFTCSSNSESNNIYYSYFLNSCQDCFGCVGLKNKQYCIFNTQYTKQKYSELVPKIIAHMQTTGEWGEFFPASLSPFGYNETAAQDYFPLTKSKARKQGFNWSNYEVPFPKVEKTIPGSKLPDSITDIPDDIFNWAIECEQTGKPFRIIPQELKFYRKHGLPIPRRHPDQRHIDRVALRNPRKLFNRNCDKCSAEMQTTYSPDRPEKVYCEDCYNKEVY